MKPGTGLRKEISPRYRTAIIVFVCLEILLLAFGLLLFDFGQLFKVTLASLIPFVWLTFWIVWKRPMNPTKIDILFIQYGHLLCIVAIFAVGAFR